MDIEWCTIDEEYLKYLKTKDERVPNFVYEKISKDGKTKEYFKPFFCVLFKYKGMNYVGQVTNPKEKHLSVSETIVFKKLFDPDKKKKLLCIVDLSYMFPVPSQCIKQLIYDEIGTLRTFSSEKEKALYVHLLKKEFVELVDRKIGAEALKWHKYASENPRRDIVRNSIQFEVVEEACVTWTKEKLNQKIKDVEEYVTTIESLNDMCFIDNDQEQCIIYAERSNGKIKAVLREIESKEVNMTLDLKMINSTDGLQKRRMVNADDKEDSIIRRVMHEKANASGN